MPGPLIEQGVIPILPDNYFVLAAVSEPVIPVTGVVACVFRANDGPVGEWREIRSLASLYNTYGDSSESSGVEVAAEALRGGAILTRCYRVGDDDGVEASLVLTDTGGGTGELQLNWRAPGTNGNLATATVEDTIDAPDDYRELRLFLSGVQKEVVRFPKGATGALGGELGELKAAIDAAGNRYVDAALNEDYASSGLLTALATPTAFTGGLNPTVAAGDIEIGVGAAEATAGQWNYLAVDTTNITVQAALVELARLWESRGIYRILVLGDPPTATPDVITRYERAADYNQPNLVYVIDAFTRRQNNIDIDVEGGPAAGRVAGMGAVAGKRFHITGAPIAGARGLPDAIASEDREAAILNGAITFTTNDRGQVAITKGITTFVVPTENRSRRWGSLLRVGRRYGYFIDVSRALSDLMFGGGGIDNDDSGRASLVGAAMGVVNDYVTQRYFRSGTTVTVDSSEESEDNRAYLAHHILDGDQIDTLINLVEFP